MPSWRQPEALGEQNELLHALTGTTPGFLGVVCIVYLPLMVVAPDLPPLEALRRRRHASCLDAFTERLQRFVAAGTPLGDGAIEVHLFGSMSRGDWDGYSDVDFLLVAEDQASAERWADRLLKAGFGSDVVAMSRSRWEGVSWSPFPHWRAVPTQAIRLLGWPT